MGASDGKQDAGNRAPSGPNVVLAISDDVFGDAVASFVVKHAWAPNPVFHLVFVVDVDGLPFMAPDLAADIQKEEEKYGRQLVERLAEKIRGAIADATVSVHIESGAPVDAILALSNAVQADWLVVGSHGRSGIRKVILGSVSDAVVKSAPCSTVIVRIGDALEPLALAGPSAVSESDLPEQMVTYGIPDKR